MKRLTPEEREQVARIRFRADAAEALAHWTRLDERSRAGVLQELQNLEHPLPAAGVAADALDALALLGASGLETLASDLRWLLERVEGR